MKFKFFNLILLFLAMLFFSNLTAQNNKLKIGDIAPAIEFEKSYTHNYKIPSGKFIFLDFWATWCGPCVASLIRSNHLVEKYKDKIEFIAITDYSSKNIEEVIKNKAIINYLYTQNKSL
ncbi:MAG: redoxin family protein [Dysgonamonadaceae bacterium]|jgi:thiol-disulfide isomerase/thioredoxin|nr:redoxin family protein [Dysgonamonadaceae bacterium]